MANETKRPLVLLDSVIVDGSGPSFVTDGGAYTLFVQAVDFGGGTVSLDASFDGAVTWITFSEGVTPIAFTVNTVRVVEGLSGGIQIRGTLTGSTSASGVKVTLV